MLKKSQDFFWSNNNERYLTPFYNIYSFSYNYQDNFRYFHNIKEALDNYSGCRKKVGDSPDIFNLRAPLGKWDLLQHFNILAVFQALMSAIKWGDKSRN